MLNEGGNVSIEKNGIVYKADKIPVKDIGIKTFQKDFKELLKKINSLYKKEYKEPLWNNEKIIDNALVFNGSTSFLMNPDIENHVPNITDLKSTSGDIDITVPEETKENVWNLLSKYEGKDFTKNFKYLGNNKPTISSIGEQINALFEYIPYKVYAQVDFEFVPFGKSKEGDFHIPTEWSKFAHSSSVNDLKENIKGVFQKYALRSLSYACSEINTDKVAFVTSAANCNNFEKKISKTKNPDSHLLKFSVTRGLRVAYEPLECNGEPVYFQGKQIFRKLKTEESIYNTSIEAIFKMLFGKDGTKQELEKFWSFVGIVDLIKKYLNKKQQETFFKRFLNLLFENKPGKNIGQELEVQNPELDYAIKIQAANYLVKKISSLKSIFEKFKPEIDRYYSQYGKTRGRITEGTKIKVSFKKYLKEGL